MDFERLRRAPDETAQHRKHQHEVPPHRTGNAAHWTLPHDDLPPRARRRVPKAPATEQEFRRLVRQRHHSMGGVAAGQSTSRNGGRAAALGWCGLRLNHPISGNLARDRPSPQLGGHAQGMLNKANGENAASLKRLRQLRRRNPGGPRIQVLPQSHRTLADAAPI